MAISPRLRRLLAPLPLTVAAGAVVLAGCGSSSTTPGVPSTPASAAQASGGPTAASPAPGTNQPSAPESNPAGDIPDNQAYVAYRPPGGGWLVKVPEGWSQATGPQGSVVFTDKLNAIRVIRRTSTPQPSTASVQGAVTTSEGSQPGFAFSRVDTVKRAAGPAYRAAYRVDGQPDPVTGKTVNDDVEQYTFWRNGVQVDLRLSGPHGADNVDPWKIITDSFRWA